MSKKTKFNKIITIFKLGINNNKIFKLISNKIYQEINRIRNKLNKKILIKRINKIVTNNNKLIILKNNKLYKIKKLTKKCLFQRVSIKQIRIK